MNRIILIFISLFVFQTGIAQEEAYSFTLQEAIDFALENNRIAQNAERDIKAAEKQKWETTATGLPQLNASVDYQNQIKQQFEAVDFNGDGIPDFAAKHSMIATASLTQKVFDGTYLVGLQSAKVYLDISKNSKEKTDLEIRKQVINAYGNVLLAEESLKVLQKNKVTLDKNLFETQKIYENGLTEEESVEQLQITLSSIENNINNTSRLKDLAYKMLNLTLGIDIHSQTNLIDNLQSLTNSNIELEILNAEDVYENAIDYKIAANDKRSKELLLKLEKSRSLPVLNAFFNGSYIANRTAFDFTHEEMPWIGTLTLGANLSIPLFTSGHGKARRQRARINLEKADFNLTETQERIKLEITNAKSEYQFAIEEYNNKKENLNLAERIEQKNRIKFFEGISSSFELRQAQTQLYNAQQEFLQTMFNVISKRADLDTILNTIK